MYIFITGDYNVESKVNEVLNRLYDLKIDEYFSKQDYCGELYGFSLVLMCRDKIHNFTQRKRYDKKERKIRMDIMLDLEEFIKIDSSERERIVAQKLVEELPLALAKYKFKNFDLPRFTEDLRSWFINNNVL